MLFTFLFVSTKHFTFMFTHYLLTGRFLVKLKTVQDFIKRNHKLFQMKLNEKEFTKGKYHQFILVQ